jgi:hypothetical protein
MVAISHARGQLWPFSERQVLVRRGKTAGIGAGYPRRIIMAQAEQ